MGGAVRQRLSSASSQIRKYEADALKLLYEILPKALEARAEPSDKARIRASVVIRLL